MTASTFALLAKPEMIRPSCIKNRISQNCLGSAYQSNNDLLTEQVHFAKKTPKNSLINSFLAILSSLVLGLFFAANVYAAVSEFNSSGGVASGDGLHFYIEDTTKIQVRRLNNTGQVYDNLAIPPSNNLDNGIFIRADSKIYGPSHNIVPTVGTTPFAPRDGTFNTQSIGAVTPANPSSSGIQQTATSSFGITSGPKVSVVWKYTTPLDFITAEVTLTIPNGFKISNSNPVRYYHMVDTYLGGDDQGCGFTQIDSNGNRVMGTYPPPSSVTTCPSNNSIPGGVSVVESFRERSGMKFSAYCAAYWWSFFTSSNSSKCYLLQSNSLGNIISSTYEDTGIAIEYDFTSTGTYTFSYDFVVGSPNVPAYDHFEIQHDGSGTLCAENITVMACTSSIVPCPAANLVNTGTLTGTINLSPTTPAVTLSPASFTLGGSATTATLSLIGASPGGTYVLSTNNLSSIPLNGIRCWNTATLSQSCSFTVSNVPCVTNFECIETGVAYNNLTTSPSARNPLYTKLAGNNFKFDVVALQSGGVQATSYKAASNVTVELFDDSASPQPACSAYTSPVASQSITFVAADSGRKTVANNFNLSNAYRKLRCRVRENNLSPVVYGCSSDQFSVRPSAVTLATTATAAAPSATATPVVKAGANFSLNATTTGGYSGTLSLDTNKLTSQITSQTSTQQSGGVVGTLTPSTLVGNASAVNSTYSEVGYLYLAPGTYRDDTFTAVDSATGDCIASTAGDNNLADTLISGKYGCSIGNTATVSMGRFIPDHFAITPGSATPACSPSFTYFGQDGFSTLFTLLAQNSSNNNTQNYQGGFGKLGLTTWGGFNFSSASLPTGSVLSASSTAPTGVWSLGLADVVAKHQVSRPTALTAETSIIVNAAPVDSDGVTMTTSAVAPGTPLRYGRIALQNAFGSELLDLPMPLTAEYWDGSWQKNPDDSCTSGISLSAATVTGPINTVCAWDTGTPGASGIGCSSAGTTVNKFNEPPLATDKGNFNLNFKAPGTGNTGSMDITATVPSFLQFNWNGAGNANPTSRATFGIYKGNDSQIFIREVY